MTGNWQNKIKDYEIAPPQEAWNKIADQLDEEFDPKDTALSQKMHDYEVQPPSFIFDNVMTGITAEEVEQPSTPVRRLPRKRFAVAAITIGLAILSLLYLFLPGSRSFTESSVVSIPTRDNPATPSPSPGEIIITPDQPSNTIVLQRDAEKKFVLNDQRSRRNARKSRPTSVRTVLPAAPENNIAVTAPPIFDGTGNVIMDESLVSSPDENYIIVTSPNGEQTKISRKFMKMLTVMNGGNDNYYVNPENFLWKMRFDEWRSKLLQQASYIPTANNFLDIMDLKELLQEN